MTDVLIDASALVISADQAGSRFDRNAQRMLWHLVDAGVLVTVSGDAALVEAIGAGIRPAARQGVVLHPGPPDEACAEQPAWLITGSQAMCDRVREQRGARAAYGGVRTVLVGGAAGASDRLDRPADVVARTFADAVLVILADDAMGPGQEPADSAPAGHVEPDEGRWQAPGLPPPQAAAPVG